MAKKRKHWAKKLNKTEKQHLKDAGCNLVSLDSFKSNLRWQAEKDIDCPECNHIALKLGLK